MGGERREGFSTIGLSSSLGGKEHLAGCEKAYFAKKGEQGRRVLFKGE